MATYPVTTKNQESLLLAMMGGTFDSDDRRRHLFGLVLEERERQLHLHPKGMDDDRGYPSRHVSMTVITEEVGELAEAIYEKDREGQKKEAIHVIASTLRFLEEVW